MTSFVKKLLGEEEHEHDWSEWREALDFNWYFKPQNFNDGENRPYIDIKQVERRYCQKKGCRGKQTRNEQYKRQYLAIESTENISSDESILE